RSRPHRHPPGGSRRRIRRCGSGRCRWVGAFSSRLCGDRGREDSSSPPAIPPPVRRAAGRGLPCSVHAYEFAAWTVLFTVKSKMARKEGVKPLDVALAFHQPGTDVVGLRHLPEFFWLIGAGKERVAGVWFINQGIFEIPDDEDGAWGDLIDHFDGTQAA